MKHLMKALLVASMALSAGAAHASTIIIDFSTGMAGIGGTLTIGADITGFNIPIDTMTVTIDGVTRVIDVSGGGICPSGEGHACALLSFDKNLNTITIVGSIPAVGLLAPFNLLSGDLSGGVNVLINNGVTGSVSFSGRDTKAPELLTALGIDPATQFKYFGFVTAVNGTGQGSPYTVVSADVTNTAIPEPTSIALFATGLVGLARATRRRSTKTVKRP